MKLFVTAEEFSEIKNAIHALESSGRNSDHQKIGAINYILNETCVKPYEAYELVVVREVKQSLLDNYNRFRQPGYDGKNYQFIDEILADGKAIKKVEIITSPNGRTRYERFRVVAAEDLLFRHSVYSKGEDLMFPHSIVI